MILRKFKTFEVLRKNFAGSEILGFVKIIELISVSSIICVCKYLILIAKVYFQRYIVKFYSRLDEETAPFILINLMGSLSRKEHSKERLRVRSSLLRK